LGKKWKYNVSAIVFGSSAPLCGFFIRNRQLIRALSMLNLSVDIVEFGFKDRGTHKKPEDSELDNIQRFILPCVSQRPTRHSTYSPLRQLAFQLESLKIVSLAGILRRSHIVMFTSCLQIMPALVSRIMGAKIILDINDVNSRVALRTQNPTTRTIHYLLWRPIESLCCSLANIVIVNKEDEGDFLNRFMSVNQSKIFVLKTCLEENQNLNNAQLELEVSKFHFGKEKVVLFLSNMSTFMNIRSAKYIINELAPSLYKLDEFKDVEFVLAGIGSDTLQPLTSNVMITGTLSQAAVDALVNRADICIDPAIISGGIKTKIQHYLQKGKVIITTPSGAEGINLYGRKDVAFLKPRIEDFEKTLKHALRELTQLKKLAANNRDIYEKQFSWKTFFNQIQKLMEKIDKTNNQH
jgi:glycosyltransferase involved in cell wall biosynthesis